MSSRQLIDAVRDETRWYRDSPWARQLLEMARAGATSVSLSCIRDHAPAEAIRLREQGFKVTIKPSVVREFQELYVEWDLDE